MEQAMMRAKFQIYFFIFNTLSAKFTKCSNTLKQFVGKLPTNYLNVFDHFVGLALKGLAFVFALPVECTVSFHGFPSRYLTSRCLIYFRKQLGPFSQMQLSFCEMFKSKDVA